jgi:glycine/D-amino acid oxidase-like deaminating enzyme
MTLLPERSELVIIGGGVVGCSIAYQLARRGKTDVTVIERLGSPRAAPGTRRA